MTTPFDVDDKIRDLLGHLDRATPDPPPFSELHQYTGPDRSRLVPLIGAAAVVALGVGGLIAVGAARDRDDSATRPPSSSAAWQTTLDATATGPLLSTGLDVGAVPFIVADQPDWELTQVFAEIGDPLSGGFEGSTVFVGDGPTYDAPLFAATVVGSTDPSTDALDAAIKSGPPIEVAGTTGAVMVSDGDSDSGLTGTVVTLFWPLDGGRFARVNSVRLSVDEVVALAGQLTLTGERLTMPVPDGYRELVTPPPPAKRRYFSYRFTQGPRELEVIGENRGLASLLGRGIASEIRTTRVIDDVEVAYRPYPNAPGNYWVDWLAGDWSYYVIASGFTSDDEFFAALSSLTLTDATTFEAAGANIGVVMPGVHNDLAGQVLAHLSLPDTAFIDAATTEMPMSADTYGVELFQGATCVWYSDWTNAVAEGDTATQASIIAAVDSTIAANTGTAFERAAQRLAVPLLDTLTGSQTQTGRDYPCPGWAQSR